MLTRPFNKFGSSGFAYTKELPKLDIPGDVPGGPMRSNLLVCENNSLLGPMRAAHADIAKEGRGRYSHWTTYLVFSASDNTDPNTNGRSYSVVEPR
jgi:pectate lyase